MSDTGFMADGEDQYTLSFLFQSPVNVKAEMKTKLVSVSGMC